VQGSGAPDVSSCTATVERRRSLGAGSGDSTTILSGSAGERVASPISPLRTREIRVEHETSRRAAAVSESLIRCSIRLRNFLRQGARQGN